MTITIVFPVKEIHAVAASFDGEVGFYVEDMTTGANHEHNADRRMPTVSVCKIPVMIELFRQVEEGALRLDDRRRLRSDISRHGTGHLKTLMDDPELTLNDYARLMIMVSDNMATDMVIDAVGLENINATMDRMGFPNTRTSMPMTGWHYLITGLSHLPHSIENNEIMYQRMAEGNQDFDGIGYTDSLASNVTTPRESATIMKMIHNGDMVSKSASAAMLELLKGCSDSSMIPHHLKSDIAVAHKIGSSRRLKVDTGIVYLPTGPMVIAAMTMSSTDDDNGSDTISEIARLAAQAVSPESAMQAAP
jgi:beta-lactamase class A